MSKEKSTTVEATSQTKGRDLDKVISFWMRRINSSMSDLPRATRSKDGPNERYQTETEIAYIINDLMQDPPCMQQVHIARGNDLLDEVIKQSRTRNVSDASATEKRARRRNKKVVKPTDTK